MVVGENQIMSKNIFFIIGHAHDAMPIRRAKNQAPEFHRSFIVETIVKGTSTISCVLAPNIVNVIMILIAPENTIAITNPNMFNKQTKGTVNFAKILVAGC
mmetsp:Transcript_21328/g.27246  ORF Transcript_21328/g.27246 Transcript_21328/m.27246 type:complete len:101 (+) Transcript_21328:1366-1668(+)